MGMISPNGIGFKSLEGTRVIGGGFRIGDDLRIQSPSGHRRRRVERPNINADLVRIHDRCRVE